MNKVKVISHDRDAASILIVDDDANSRLLLKTYLSAEGHKVITARSGEEALCLWQEKSLDLIVLDVRLPGIDGYEVCRTMKGHDKGVFIPIVMATALRGNDQRIMGVEAGADDFIGKPYNRVELTTRIKSLLRIRALHRILEEKIDELESAREKLNRLAITDGLTGLFNYRAFRHQLRLEISRASRFHLPLSLLMIDIDHFKRYNDTFGHPAGDKLLRQFSKLVISNLRDVDCSARYGGEEFAIILPGTNKNDAGKVAEKLRKLIEQAPFHGIAQLPGKAVTISIGVAAFPHDGQNGEALIKLADHALYNAKHGGRNQWLTA